MPLGLLRRIESYLGEFLSQKSRTKGSFSDVSFSRSSSNCSIATDEGLFEVPEPLASSKVVMDKILWRRSLQLQDQQQAWQVWLLLIDMKHMFCLLLYLFENKQFVRLFSLKNILEMLHCWSRISWDETYFRSLISKPISSVFCGFELWLVSSSLRDVWIKALKCYFSKADKGGYFTYKFYQDLDWFV